MGLDMELDFEKYCKVGRTPKPPRHRKKREKNQSKKDRLSSGNDLFVLEEEECLTELKLRNYRSVSCKNLPTREVDVESREKVLRRGSVYESSSNRKLNRSEVGGGRRKKIEFSLDTASPFSFSILDSICGLDEDVGSLEQECSSVMSAASSSMFSSKASRGRSSQEFMNNLSDREGSSAKCAERDLMENHMYKSDQVIGPPNNANVLKDRDSVALQKSLSAKLALPHSPTRSTSDHSKGSSSPKSRFTPIRKMFDPLMKSKSHRSPLSSTTEDRSDPRSATNEDRCGPRSAEPANVFRNNKTFRKSLLHDFSSATQSSELDRQAVKRDYGHHHHHHQQQQKDVSPPCSPAHLRGNLKLEYKHGVPYFEFSFSHTEDVFVAKTWKAEDTLNWVYTFHAVQGRKRSSANGWGMKYSNKDSPMVGQMQVSSHLCSELRDGGNSMVTEFVLYDIAHARKSSCAAEEETGITSDDIVQVLNAATNKGLVKDTLEFEDFFDQSIKLRTPVTGAHDLGSLDFSSPYPLAPVDLHPNLEIAAVVIQVPLEKRESLKYKTDDKIRKQIHTDMLNESSELEQHVKKGSANSNSRAKVNVVTPMGNHGLPVLSESRGPSPLLDRWRLGGGCDCGGWDMACPLVVFGKCGVQHEEDVSLLEKDRPLELHVQGTRDKTPALSISVTEKGQCAVYFHAQLSTVQAFAICVAVLHATEASMTTEQEKNRHLLQCSSTKVLIEDEVKQLIKSVTEEEVRKATVKTAEETSTPFVIKERRKAAVKTAEENPTPFVVRERRTAAAKTADENPPSFVVNPPFSPIARV